MNIATLFKSKRITLELAALFVFVLVLTSNLVVIRFAEGYFSFFNISMGEINFVPQMYDYVRIALPVILTSIVVTFLVLCILWLAIKSGDVTARFTRLSGKIETYILKHRKIFVVVAYILDFLIKILLAVVLAWIIWVLLYTTPVIVGKLSAENNVQMTSISNQDESMQKVIIYKGDNELILKTYDVSKHEFIDGYEVLYGASYTSRTISR